MNLAPIIIFAFNRPDALKNTINSLTQNPEAKDSELFIFIDGPRNKDEKLKTDEVLQVAKSIKGFKSINITASEKNRGLGSSIIAGVSKIIDKYGKAIVLEDDLILQPNFLAFINQGLDKYEDRKDVFSICGYTNRVKSPKNYPYDAYMCTRSSSWGWATWKDRWDSVDWNPEPWDNMEKYKKDFNKWGGSDCFGMLEGWKNGANHSWAIRFCFAQFLQNKLSVFPIKSLVKNNGFDGEGTNCKKWSRFKYDLMESSKKEFSFPEDTTVIRSFFKEAIKYHSIPKRLISRIMYIIYS